MGREKLIAGYKEIIGTIYSPKYYYERIATFIHDFDPSARSTTTRADFWIFLQSLWVIGVLSKSRLRFWRLLFKTAFTKTRAFPVAIELAVLGVHFDKVAKKVAS
jgi:hypothetical protein